MGGTNFVTNPSFETNTTGWTFAGCTPTRDTNATPGTGTYTAKMTASGGAAMSAKITLTGLTVGQQYIVQFSAKIAPVGANLFSMVASVPGTDLNMAQSTKSETGYFVRPVASFTASTSSLVLTIASSTVNTSGDVAWIDLVHVTGGNAPGPYFDGTYPLSSWTGTAHNSTSTCSALVNTSGLITTPEIVIVGTLCLNTYAFNITSKTGRYTVPSVRGDDITVPGARGKQFVANKPIDTGLWSLTMFILGANDSGIAPPFETRQRDLFDKNFEKILSAAAKTSSTVPIYAWQPDCSVRTTQAAVVGSNTIEATMFMGGKRAELTLAFDVLSGTWKDYLSSTVVGTAGSHWSNDVLSITSLSGGTVDIEDSVITVTGPITNPRLTDPATGVWVQYTGSLLSSDTWNVDTAAFTSKKNTTSVLANTTHFGYPKFLLISSGNYLTAPSITLTGTGTGSTTNLSITATRNFWTA